MKSSGLTLEKGWYVVENAYDLSTEANVASLMTTGNGYIGVRASLEEYGSLHIQGTYIRGLCDKIVDLRLPYCDNMYMKKYYVNEDKLKKFTTQESIINIIDFLLIRFEIDGQTFYPWEGNLISWKRILDIKRGCLCREVVWETDKGQQTRFCFERFSSMSDDHTYCMTASATPLNYSAPVRIISGLDLRTKTNGQIITRPVSSFAEGNEVYHENLAGEFYGFHCGTGARSDFYATDNAKATVGNTCDEDFVTTTFDFEAAEGQTYTVEKKIYIIASIDTKDNLEKTTRGMLKAFAGKRYADLQKESLAAYEKLFGCLDITIKGDDNADASVRFANYHTLISIARNDAVHSLAAKGLTGEAYNDFVWWDSEVYQTPIFMQTMPDAVRYALRYRYDRLDKAREIAKSEGRKGARFPFTSCVTGEETVWSDVRHPFMQIHIVSDIALAVIKYYKYTGDVEFLRDYGFELLIEICRYWVTRVEWVEEKGRYEIHTVTGTDEHHPYVDNNAYTNYSVHIALTETLRLLGELADAAAPAVKKTGCTDADKADFARVADKLYLPMEKNGMIPQFDGYFGLSRTLEIQGGSSATNFQMKFSGLYNKSQVIKQPDVMLLFSYMDMDFGTAAYARNWNYYEARCEASSSLSYPVHAICAADLDQPDSAYKYLLKSARLDMDDEHNCARDGMHSACAAGAWLAVARGVAGMRLEETGVRFAPHFIPWWEEVTFHAVWHRQGYTVTVDNDKLTVTADKANDGKLPVTFADKTYTLAAGESFTAPIVLN